ncbi:MAG: carbonic anhydrase [Chitinophagaceae bacterium]|nr:carbonic anhydrase [Chitinophagaceae bacterium]
MRSAVLFILSGCCLFIFTTCRNTQAPLQHTNNEPLTDLMEGNQRFATHHATHPHSSGERMKSLESGQHPPIAVICCSDSRVPPEIVFDQGLGDMFVVRTAGNLLGGLEIGSIEYAVEHLGVKEILVMGHRECGAVKAFIEGGSTPGHIRDIVDSIRAEQEISQIPANDKNLLNDCIQANILHGIHQLKKQSDMIAEKIREGKLQIHGACYDLSKGKVEIINE